MDTPHPPNCPDLLLHLTCQYFVEIACPEPNIPKHTQRNRKLSAIGFAEGTTLHYGCSSGYETTNPLNIRCQSNGQWTSTPPVCKGECGWADKTPTMHFPYFTHHDLHFILSLLLIYSQSRSVGG